MECYEQAIQIDPQYSNAWNGKGSCLNELKEYAKAIECYEQAIQINPQYSEAWDGKGLSFHNLKEYEKAIECFDQAIQINPQYSEAWNNKGDSLHQLKEYEKAIECYDRAIQIYPQYANAWKNKGDSLSWLNEYEKSIECYDHAIQIYPQYSSAWKNKGICLNELKEYGKAIECFDQAIQIYSQFSEAWDGKGLSLWYLNEYKKSIECYDQAIQINPQYSSAWDGKGLSLFSLKEYEKAIECCDQAIQIDPQFSNAWNRKGSCLNQLKEYEKAIECYDQAIQIDPQFSNAWFGKGYSLYYLKEYIKAIECFDQAIQIDPQYSNAWNWKGYILNELKEYEKAIECFDWAIQINPQYSEAWYGKGEAYSHLKEYKKAIECYDHATQINPEYSEAWYGKGEAYSHLKEYEKAVECYDHATQINPEYSEAWHSKGFALNELIKIYEFKSSPEKHLGFYQSLIEVCRHTRPGEVEEVIRNAMDLLARFLADPQYSLSQKIAIQRHLPYYNQLRIDELIKSEKIILALKLAEQRKNDCLKWLFSSRIPKNTNPTSEQKINSFARNFQQTMPTFFSAFIFMQKNWQSLLSNDIIQTFSSQYKKIKTLLKPDTAVIYWHISPTAISTFILKYEQKPIVQTILFEPSQLTRINNNLQRFEDRMNQWLKNYKDYCQPNKNSEQNSSKIRENHPWRQEMITQIEELRDILKIQDICQNLLDVQKLILIPHRDLHTLPLETLFTEPFLLPCQNEQGEKIKPRYILTRLPDAKSGIDQQLFPPIYNPSMLLIEQPQGKTSLPFAQIEAMALKQIYQTNHHHLSGDFSKDQVIDNLSNPITNLFHFTGHASHNIKEPTKSCLYLNDQDQLTITDIYQLINKTAQYYQIVCLNGCETGITTRDNMIDELIGLASAFLPKTQYVIGSLWRVDDRASALLMIEFYRLLRTNNAIESLDQARYWLRNLTNDQLAQWYEKILIPILQEIFDESKSKPLFKYLKTQIKLLNKPDIIENKPYEHPYYWGAFTITGNFQP